MPEDANRAAKFVFAYGGVTSAIPDAAGTRTQERREHGEQRRLPCSVGTEQADHGALMRLECDVGYRAAPAEMAGDVLDPQVVEINRARMTCGGRS